MNIYRIKIAKRAKRDIKKFDPDVQKQIREAIDGLALNPRLQSSKLMKGRYKGYRRERMGDYRVIYEVRDKKLIVLVIRVGHRRDIYE